MKSGSMGIKNAIYLKVPAEVTVSQTISLKKNK